MRSDLQNASMALAAFALSSLILAKIYTLLDLERYRATVLLCYGCFFYALLGGQRWSLKRPSKKFR
ncbi:MAG: hypothetical protein ACU826_03155 [Gammaproteobacteria bacterium]